MADHNVGRLTVTEQADQCSRIILGRVQREVRVGDIQRPLAHDPLDTATRTTTGRVP